MADYTKAVVNVLKENGCYFVRRGKGDYSLWYSPVSNKNFPVESKIKPRHTAIAVMKQSGASK